MEDIRLITSILGDIKTNCYITGSRNADDIIIIDPADEAEKIKSICERDALRPAAVLLTHGHFDHILAAKPLADEYGIPIYAGAAEKELLADPKKNCSRMVNRDVSIETVRLVED